MAVEDRPLTGVDEHGEVIEHATCASCENLQRQLNTALKNLAMAERKNTEKDVTIEAMKAARREERELQRQQSKRRAEVEEIWEDFQKKTGFTTLRLGARHDVIQARLNEGYTVEHFKLANIAAANDPFTSGKYPTPLQDIGKWAKHGWIVEEYANRGAAWLTRTGVPTEPPFSSKERPLLRAKRAFVEAGLGFVEDEELGMALAVCPVCTRQMTVVEDTKEDRVFFDCKQSGCSHEDISHAAHRLRNEVLNGRRQAS